MTGPVIAEARLWIGTPYCHQASVRGAGTDCLGLLRGIWRAVIGPEPQAVPAYTADWSEAGAREDLRAACERWLLPQSGPLAAGDVLLFQMRRGAVAKHLGICSAPDGAPCFIHAYTGHGVVESPLSDAWARRIVGRYRFPVKG